MKISFKVLPLTIIILFDAQLFSAPKLWELPRVVPTFIRCFTTRAICPITIRRNVEAEFDKASIPLKLPAKVNTTLVTMRDGIQGQQKSVDLKKRRHLISQEAGIVSELAYRQEIGSFVKPSLVPAVAQPDLLIGEMINSGMSPTAKRMSILVPNQRGFEDFVKFFQKLPLEWQEALEVAFFTSACPEFLKRNTGFSSVEQHLKAAEQILKDASHIGVFYRRAFVSMAFRSPFSEEDLTDRAFEICQALYDMDYTEVVPADTNGIASVAQVIKLFHRLRKAKIPRECLGFHGHDLGNEIAAVLASLPFVTTIDATVLGIGGCPFSPGSPGNMNIRTVNDTHRALGISTGISASHLASAETALRYVLNAII